MTEHVTGCVIDELGGGITSYCGPDQILYRLGGETIAVIERGNTKIDMLGANDLDAVALLQHIRGLMFALERLMQIEFARRNQAPVGPQIIDFGNEVVL